MQTASEYTAFVFFPENNGALTKVYGLTVLERTLHALERGGVARVFLPEKTKSEAAAAMASRKDWKIEVQFTDQPLEMGGAESAGLIVLSQPLVLDPKIPQQLPEQPLQKGQYFVSQNENIAFFPADVVSVLRKNKPGGEQSLAAWRSAAGQSGVSVKTVAFEGLLCHTLNTPEEKKAVKKALIRSLIKPSDGWVARHLNRPVSTNISRVLAYTSITPNQFTIVTGLVGVATGVFAAMGGYWNFLIAGTLFHLTSILDGVDGELARLKFKSSPFGQWLDTIVDNLSYVVGLGGIIIGIYRTGASDAVKIAAGLAVVFVVLALGSMYLYLLRFKSGGTLLSIKYSFQDGDGWFDKVMQVAAAFGKRDLFALIFFVLGIFGQLPMALGYVAIMAFFVFAFSLQAHFKAASERDMAGQGH